MTKPILFSGPMILAIERGDKTQTRRAIKPHPPDTVTQIKNYGGEDFFMLDKDGEVVAETRSPYGIAGDTLWTRESWSLCGQDLPDGSPQTIVKYKADNPDGICDTCGKKVKWKPSIHMSRSFSRRDLEVTGIRVERLQSITEKDAKAEGAEPGRVLGMGRIGMKSYREGFAILWDSINGKKPGYSWHDNPWVYVIEFKKA